MTRITSGPRHPRSSQHQDDAVVGLISAGDQVIGFA